MYVDPTGEFAFALALLLIGLGCTVATAAVGGVSAAINNENIWDGIWKGALVGLMLGGSIALIATGVGTAVAGTIWGSILVGGGVGSFFTIGINLNNQLNNGGFGSLNIKSVATSWALGGGVGALAGAMGHAGKILGTAFGEKLGLSLAGKYFWGKEISKIISKSFLMKAGGILGGFLGGSLTGKFINDFATKSGMQNQNIPLWLGTIIKFIFGK